jgi:Family of unknown function (DUF6221)
VTDLIAGFLAARYDEAEAIAKAAAHKLRVRNAEPWFETDDDRFGFPEDAAYIAANDPASRLRDIAGKRAIVALHSASIAKRDGYPFSPWTGRPQPEENDGDCGLCGWFAPEDGGCLTVRHLAAEFAGHPDCKPGWVPSDAT